MSLLRGLFSSPANPPPFVGTAQVGLGLSKKGIVEGRPRSWKWTYRPLPGPQLRIFAKGAPSERQVTFIGWWEHDDDRAWYKSIKVVACLDGRFFPYAPYWWNGYSPAGPCFGFAYLDRHWRLNDAIAFCGVYLAQKEVEW